MCAQNCGPGSLGVDGTRGMLHGRGDTVIASHRHGHFDQHPASDDHDAADPHHVDGRHIG